MKLLIIAGGTGGHIFPALVVAEALQKQGVQIEWMGTEKGMEKKLVGNRFPLHFLPIKALRGKSVLTKLMMPFRLFHSILIAYRMIKKMNPDCVLGMGGYASGPGGMAAWLLRKKLVIHEQNANPGLTNRLLSHIATTVLQAFPNAFSKSVNAITVGNPVRASIMQLYDRKKNQHREKPWRILILGGSQGATAINRLVPAWLTQCAHRDDFLVWHQTGQRDFESTQQQYAHLSASLYGVSPFIDDMEKAYAWADLVVCRSGALTVSEIAAAGLPSILIPYPYAVDDHQYANAQFLVQSGAAVAFRESECTVEKLDETIHHLFSSSEHLHQMANQARICAKVDSVSQVIAQLF